MSEMLRYLTLVAAPGVTDRAQLHVTRPLDRLCTDTQAPRQERRGHSQHFPGRLRDASASGRAVGIQRLHLVADPAGAFECRGASRDP